MKRVVFDWIFGIAGCVPGLEFSLRMDSAAGPSVIATLLVMMLLFAVSSPLVRKVFKPMQVKATGEGFSR